MIDSKMTHHLLCFQFHLPQPTNHCFPSENLQHPVSADQGQPEMFKPINASHSQK